MESLLSLLLFLSFSFSSRSQSGSFKSRSTAAAPRTTRPNAALAPSSVHQHDFHDSVDRMDALAADFSPPFKPARANRSAPAEGRSRRPEQPDPGARTPAVNAASAKPRRVLPVVTHPALDHPARRTSNLSLGRHGIPMPDRQHGSSRILRKKGQISDSERRGQADDKSNNPDNADSTDNADKTDTSRPLLPQRRLRPQPALIKGSFRSQPISQPISSTPKSTVASAPDYGDVITKRVLPVPPAAPKTRPLPPQPPPAARTGPSERDFLSPAPHSAPPEDKSDRSHSRSIRRSPGGKIPKMEVSMASGLQLTRDGAELMFTSNSTGPVLSVASSSGGSMVATASSDGAVRLYDTFQGRVTRELLYHQGAVCTVAFSPSGSRLASGGDDGCIAVWDVRTGELLRTLDFHKVALELGRVNAVSLVAQQSGDLVV